MIKLSQIENFLKSEPIAIAGVSRNPKKFGYIAFNELRKRGLNVIPVNPYAEEILGTKTFKNISDLPPEVNSLVVLTRTDQTEAIVKEAVRKGIENIWIQQMSETSSILKEYADSKINLITGECILMYYKPRGIHKIHRFLKKLFGKYPE